ncbi:MAG: hypothetical protein IIC56_04590 [Proteobacteria bacterium]|nr:hypothetical protein [Pseudomonadota bacterium]
MTGDLFEQAGIRTAAQSKAKRKPPGKKTAKKAAPKDGEKTAPAAESTKPRKTAKKKPLRKAAAGRSPAAAPKAPRKGETYSAKDIEVLEGLEPVRRRPGMYIGGIDERALHHLVAEILDNAMDEAVAGHASRIDIHLAEDQTVTITDNGRGIPIDLHPKFKDKSALEVILTTLHSGGKFGGDVYETAGGLHGVGLSVVNALSDRLTVDVARDKKLWRQSFVRGEPVTPLESQGAVRNRRGTTVAFHPDPKIFGSRVHFRPALLYRMARSKAYLFRGIEIRRSDQAPCVKRLQGELLERLRDAQSLAECRAMKEELAGVVRRAEDRIRYFEVPIEELVLRRKTSREAHEYRSNNITAVAARQAVRAGFPLHAGEAVQMLVLDAKNRDPDSRVRILPLLQPEDVYDAEF